MGPGARSAERGGAAASMLRHAHIHVDLVDRLRPLVHRLACGAPAQGESEQWDEGLAGGRGAALTIVLELVTLLSKLEVGHASLPRTPSGDRRRTLERNRRSHAHAGRQALPWQRGWPAAGRVAPAGPAAARAFDNANQGAIRSLCHGHPWEQPPAAVGGRGLREQRARPHHAAWSQHSRLPR